MSRLAVHLAGLGLFLFIPAVLFLLVGHPDPVAVSATAGVLLMVGHRFLARPFLVRVRHRRCAWCARVDGDLRSIEVGGEELGVCPRHETACRSFLAYVGRHRLVFRIAIVVPLLLLILALVAAAAGRDQLLEPATALFRLAVGVTVQVAATGPFRPAGDTVIAAAFPLHNFVLLGIRNLLWLFRVVGAVWIVQGGWQLLRLLE